MFISSLKCRNFRNLNIEPLRFTPGVNVLCGKNAQGKTNLLEAIYLCSSGSSFRAGKERDLIAFGQTEAEVELMYTSAVGEAVMGVQLYADSRRKVLLQNGLQIKKVSEFLSHFLTVVFTPEHLRLIKDGPQERREFLDNAISQLRPKYYTASADYQRILVQKNALLKKITYGGGDPALLEVWDDRLATYGAYITMLRASYVKKLEKFAADQQDILSKGKEKLTLQYKNFLGNDEDEILTDAKALKQRFMEKIAEARPEELQNATAVVGPHRDDLEISLSGKNLRLFGSQGQQRSAALTLKLAECELVKEEEGEYPVLLLDDILSELDRNRQKFILEQIRDKQVILTTCDRTRYKRLGASAVLVEEGGVTPL